VKTFLGEGIIHWADLQASLYEILYYFSYFVFLTKFNIYRYSWENFQRVCDCLESFSVGEGEGIFCGRNSLWGSAGVTLHSGWEISRKYIPHTGIFDII